MALWWSCLVWGCGGKDGYITEKVFDGKVSQPKDIPVVGVFLSSAPRSQCWRAKATWWPRRAGFARYDILAMWSELLPRETRIAGTDLVDYLVKILRDHGIGQTGPPISGATPMIEWIGLSH